MQSQTPITPITPKVTGSKTLFMGNLSYSIEENDVYVLFDFNCLQLCSIRIISDKVRDDFIARIFSKMRVRLLKYALPLKKTDF